MSIIVYNIAIKTYQICKTSVYNTDYKNNPKYNQIIYYYHL